MNTIDHIAGHTFHGRKGQIKNAFRYSIDYVLFDAEKPVRGPALFSRNAANFASVHDTDHGGPPRQGEGPSWARRVLDSHQIRADGKLLLLTQPRVLGYVFNPVSFWLAHNGHNELIAVIAEVSNTFGDRHSYLCAKADGTAITRHDKLKAQKIFHVSPFQPTTGEYTFRFDFSDQRIGVWIDYGQDSGGIIATLTGERQTLTNQSLLKAILRRPFGARRVTALIYWQALKLRLKGASYRPRPAPPERDVS